MAGNVVVKVEDYGYIRGQDGASAYEQAVEGGYPGTEEQFAQDLINFAPLAAQAAESATAAQTAQGLAETAQGAAEAAQSAAQGYAGSASDSAILAAQFENNASGYAGRANAFAGDAEYSASVASSERTAAEAAQAEATRQAGIAETQASAAATSAGAASTSATNAATSAGNAAASATAAGNAQTAAETAQGLAETAQTAAETAQGLAEDAAESVSGSAEQISQNAADISDLKSAFSAFRTEVGFSTEDVTIEYPEQSSPSLLSTSFRRFWPDIIPANSHINSVDVPIFTVGADPWFYVEVWELSDDGTTLTKAKTVTTTLSANTTAVFSINFTSNKRCMIAQYSSNVQHHYVSGGTATGKIWYLSRSTTVSTEEIAYSTLEAYTNMYLCGEISYTVKIDTYKSNIPLNWKHGIFQINAGEIYSSGYPAITEMLYPTSIADYVLLNETGYIARIGYYDGSNGNYQYKTYTQLTKDTETTINKNYDYFCLSLFIDWSTAVQLEDCNNILYCYTVKTIAETAKLATVSNYNAENNSRKITAHNKRFNLDFISISHQGFSYTDIPNHNKADGYALAAQVGFDYGETDIKMTGDDVPVPVCCHDATFVDATSGVTVTISTSTYAELQSHDYYGGKIASFDDVCKTCKSNGIGIVIDQATVESVPYVSAILSKYSMWKKSKWMLVYHPEYPNLAKDISDAVIAVNPNANFIIDIEFDNEAAIAYAKTLKTANNEVWFHLPYLSYTTEQIAAIMEEDGVGYGMSVYTIDSLEKCKEYMPYVTGIISNQYSIEDILNS